MDKFLKMESSGSKRVEKEGHELDADADDHPPEPKKQRLPALARFLFFLSFFLFHWILCFNFYFVTGANLIA